jgi:hypothetical protein
VLIWFVATAVVAVWYVFRDPSFDYRLLVVGALLPDAVDIWFGGARVMHSIVTSVVVLVVVVLATTTSKPLRRMLLPLSIGMFLHLVFDGAWTNSQVFWWPLLGTSFDDAPLPTVERGWWSLVLEAIGVVIAVWVWRWGRLREPDRRDALRRHGTLMIRRR